MSDDAIGLVHLIALAGLGISTLLVLGRLVKGPTNADRAVALDTILLIMVSVVALIISATRSYRFAPLLLAFALLGFVGTVAFARFVERHPIRGGLGGSPDASDDPAAADPDASDDPATGDPGGAAR